MTAPQTTSATTAATSSSEPAGGNPPAAPPWRAGHNAPSWAQGRGAEEILGIAQQAVDALSRFNQAPQAIQPPAAPMPMMEDETFIDGKTFKAAMQNAGQQINPWLQRSIQMSSDAMLAGAMQQYPKEFKRYYPDIMGKLALVPRDQWTLDTMRIIINLVKGDHVEDYAQERAEELLRDRQTTLRSNGSSGSLPGQPQTIDGLSLESEKLPAPYRDRLAKVGMTLDQVREFCRSNDMELKDWFTMAEKAGSSLIGETI